jgi:hypothetical protein
MFNPANKYIAKGQQQGKKQKKIKQRRKLMLLKSEL